MKKILFLLLFVQTLAFSQGSGKKVTPPTSTPVSVTNNAAPFSFNSTTQALNIPKTPTLVDNGNGTITFAKGDGTSVTVAAADDKINSALTIGGVTYAAGTSFETLFTALNSLLHSPTTVTNNAAPFSFNSGTQSLNVPQQNKLQDNGDGTMKFIRGDGTGFDSVQVYLIPEPMFFAKYILPTETLLNSIQTISYTQGGMSKTLQTRANQIYIDTLAASIQNINIPDPSLVANSGFNFSITWLKVPNQITFNYPIFDRILGTLYSSTTFVPDTRDFSTIPTLRTDDILFKSFAYTTVNITNINGKYFIQR